MAANIGETGIGLVFERGLVASCESLGRVVDVAGNDKHQIGHAGSGRRHDTFFVLKDETEPLTFRNTAEALDKRLQRPSRFEINRHAVVHSKILARGRYAANSVRRRQIAVNVADGNQGFGSVGDSTLSHIPLSNALDASVMEHFVEAAPAVLSQFFQLLP